MSKSDILVLSGEIERPAPSRTFVDGQLFADLTVVANDGERKTLDSVFCTNPILELLAAPGSKDIYIWNRHVFAVKCGGRLVADLEGVKRSFFRRDRALLGGLALTIVMLPYVLWVIGKKLKAIRSFPTLEGGHVIS